MAVPSRQRTAKLFQVSASLGARQNVNNSFSAQLFMTCLGLARLTGQAPKALSSNAELGIANDSRAEIVYLGILR
jgi:hypothetical protein